MNTVQGGTVTEVKIYTLQICLFFYAQDPDYSISHTIWHFSTLINESNPKIKILILL
jgi:hypothetical protein